MTAVAQGGALGCVATSQNQNKKQTTDEVRRVSGGRKLQVEVAGKTGMSDLGQVIIIPFSTLNSNAGILNSTGRHLNTWVQWKFNQLYMRCRAYSVAL